MSHSDFDKFSQKGGKCPMDILTKFQKKEENVHRLFMQVFNNRSKMSLGHSDIISQKGVKCPSVILSISKNHLDSWEEKIRKIFLGELSLGCK